jgi:TRAP-type C4-dicarboxylate transport system substrate-binding protein
VARVVLGAVLLALAPPATSQIVKIKMGTLAPEGSPWHDVLVQMREEWRELSGGKVDLRIYPGGVLGDEKDMIRRTRIGQLHAVAITGSGLATIEPAVSALQVPLMFDSYEELDYVRDRLAPKLESLLEEKGFKVLNWGDAGWVHFFGNQPISTLDEIRGLKLLTSAGDPKTEALYKDFGFNVVPLAYTDVLTALQTGMVDVVQGPPLYAMLEQWFGLANHMVGVRWAPLIGATLVRTKTWNRIRPEWKEGMLTAARVAGDRLRGDIRRLGEEAVPEMLKRGLEVVEIDEERFALWRAETLAAYPKLRGTYAPAEMFDEVQRLRDEFRATRASEGKATPR